MRFLIQEPNFVGIYIPRLVISCYSAKLNFLIPACLQRMKFSDTRRPAKYSSCSFLRFNTRFISKYIYKLLFSSLLLYANNFLGKLLFIYRPEFAIFLHALFLHILLVFTLNFVHATRSVQLEKKIIPII